MSDDHGDVDWDNMEWCDEAGDFVLKKIEGSSLEFTSENEEETVETKDANGKILESGDVCKLTKDLNVKGSALNLKIGTKVKVRVGDNQDLVECKIGKTTIFIKTCFLKK